MTTTLTSRVDVRASMLEQAHSRQLRAWHRVGCLAWARADGHGHARFTTGAIARELGLTAQQVSDALATARGRGWIDPASTARCVVLPGHALNPCEERHR